MKLIPSGTNKKEVEAANRRADKIAGMAKLFDSIDKFESNQDRLLSRLKRELPDLPPQEAEDFVIEFIAKAWPKFLDRYPALKEKSESELRAIMYSHFEKSVIRPARTEIAKLLLHKPAGTSEREDDDESEGEVNPIDGSDLPENVPVRTFMDDAVHEARAAGFEVVGLAWAEYKPSVEHLLLAHLFDAVWRDNMGPHEALEVFMAAVAGKDVSTPTRANQRLSTRRLREGGKRRATAGPASKEALEAIRKAEKAIRSEHAR